jgi:hypothetical protein
MESGCIGDRWRANVNTELRGEFTGCRRSLHSMQLCWQDGSEGNGRVRGSARHNPDHENGAALHSGHVTLLTLRVLNSVLAVCLLHG